MFSTAANAAGVVLVIAAMASSPRRDERMTSSLADIAGLVRMRGAGRMIGLKGFESGPGTAFVNSLGEMALDEMDNVARGFPIEVQTRCERVKKAH
jgi:hypothetical protein